MGDREKEKRRSRSTGWKHFPEPGGGHIDCSKVPAGNALRELVCTLEKRYWAQPFDQRLPDCSVSPSRITGGAPLSAKMSHTFAKEAT